MAFIKMTLPGLLYPPDYYIHRYSWVINANKSRDCELALAHNSGQVIGAFRPAEWLPATHENFPGLLGEDPSGRWGFVGEPAESEIWSFYVGKQVPERYRRVGAANPIRYCAPGDA
jgi:hypothetical protein